MKLFLLSIIKIKFYAHALLGAEEVVGEFQLKGPYNKEITFFLTTLRQIII